MINLAPHFPAGSRSDLAQGDPVPLTHILLTDLTAPTRPHEADTELISELAQGVATGAVAIKEAQDQLLTYTGAHFDPAQAGRAFVVTHHFLTSLKGKRFANRMFNPHPLFRTVDVPHRIAAYAYHMEDHPELAGRMAVCFGDSFSGDTRSLVDFARQDERVEWLVSTYAGIKRDTNLMIDLHSPYSATEAWRCREHAFALMLDGRYHAALELIKSFEGEVTSDLTVKKVHCLYHAREYQKVVEAVEGAKLRFNRCEPVTRTLVIKAYLNTYGLERMLESLDASSDRFQEDVWIATTIATQAAKEGKYESADRILLRGVAASPDEELEVLYCRLLNTANQADSAKFKAICERIPVQGFSTKMVVGIAKSLMKGGLNEEAADFLRSHKDWKTTPALISQVVRAFVAQGIRLTRANGFKVEGEMSTYVGKLLLRLGQYRTIISYHSNRQEWERDPARTCVRASALSHLGRLDDALKVLKEYVGPPSAYVNNMLAGVHHRMGNGATALGVLAKADREQRDAHTLTMFIKLMKAQGMLPAALDLVQAAWTDPVDRGLFDSVLVRKFALELLFAGKQAQALEFMDEAITAGVAPKHSKPMIEMTGLLIEGRYAEADRRFTGAHGSEIEHLRAEVKLQLGDRKGAKSLLINRVETNDPLYCNPSSWRLLCDILIEDGEVAELEQLYEDFGRRFAARIPDTGVYIEASILAGKGDIDEAERLLREETLHSEHVESRHRLANFLVNRGKVEEAFEIVRERLEDALDHRSVMLLASMTSHEPAADYLRTVIAVCEQNRLLDPEFLQDVARKAFTTDADAADYSTRSRLFAVLPILEVSPIDRVAYRVEHNEPTPGEREGTLADIPVSKGALRAAA